MWKLKANETSISTADGISQVDCPHCTSNINIDTLLVILVYVVVALFLPASHHVDCSENLLMVIIRL